MKTFAFSPRPQSSIWGAIQEADQILPGIWSVTTPSHGGLILSDQRQQAMPDSLRIEGASYEEDVDWSHVILAHEAEIARLGRYPASFLQLARDTVRCWHPDAFSAFTGESVTENQSHVLKRRKAYQDSIGELCVTAAWGSWADWVPEGKTGVVGMIVESVNHLGFASYAGERQFALVDAKIYEGRKEPASFASLGAELIDCPPGMNL
ncbi:DUF7007 domain-containing protein [Novosphingobium sp. JCM 18896]|uniref:DUF7007 domain-containing protein n=1 Tax=Novosphingobium sp. JCM 18896 TaxID=2989731 RepID=UPI0022232E72|nr:hypothetical protein [Novosphingobium sp. JCM 18896]MCW1431985.1 hypothetical protein [Novosphingobium sp. JCM 18896]